MQMSVLICFTAVYCKAYTACVDLNLFSLDNLPWRVEAFYDFMCVRHRCGGTDFVVFVSSLQCLLQKFVEVWCGKVW